MLHYCSAALLYCCSAIELQCYSATVLLLCLTVHWCFSVSEFIKFQTDRQTEPMLEVLADLKRCLVGGGWRVGGNQKYCLAQVQIFNCYQVDLTET